MVRNSKVRIIDPLFLIPEEVGDFDYSENLLGELDTEEVLVGEEGEEPESFLYDEGEEDYFDDPETPDLLTVVAQNIRTLENGTQVVDLIVDVEDIAGVDRYDFRIVQI